MKFKNPFESWQKTKAQRIPTIEEYTAGYIRSGRDPRDLRWNSQKEIDQLWLDLNEVGKTKALGYLPIDTLFFVCGVKDLQKLAKSYEEKGLKTKFLNHYDGTLFNLTVWDEAMLQKLLNENSDLLKKEGWPMTTEAFVDEANKTTVPDGPLYDLIARAYNDPRYRDSN